jgi:hypothetical protein
MARCRHGAIVQFEFSERQVLKVPATTKIEATVAANVFKP